MTNAQAAFISSSRDQRQRITEMQISHGKYRTRNGQVAVVLTADAPVTYGKVIGYIIAEQDGYSYSRARTWEYNGRLYTTIQDEDDIMERIEE